MKIWVVAGGTGGHFYPGLSVAKECLANGHNVRFVVRKNDYILPLLIRENIPFTEIYAAGLRRSLHPVNLFVPIKLILGFLVSIISILRFRPDVVLVMGGYLSVPPALSAWLFRIPLVLHEQNAWPGLANRFLSMFARKVAVSFPGSEHVFGGKSVLTGNPLRPEFAHLPSTTEALNKMGLNSDKKTVLVFGGSLGAHVINRVVLDVLKLRKDLAKKIQMLHVTGLQDELFVKKEYAELPFKYVVLGYCHDMVSAYVAADFVVCRAGASTITELIAVRKPAFLIPYPYATGDHQTKNARVLERAGAAVVCQENSLLQDRLAAAFDDVVRPQKPLELNMDFKPLKAASEIRVLAELLV